MEFETEEAEDEEEDIYEEEEDNDEVRLKCHKVIRYIPFLSISGV
jgi:hypothetical protein